MSMGAISDSLASATAFSAVPPMPMPSMPGGHQPAPICGIISSTQSTMESLGFIILNLVLFSDPPPLAATSTITLSPCTISTFSTQGVLSRSEEHTSELQSLMRTSYAVFCLKKKNTVTHTVTVRRNELESTTND